MSFLSRINRTKKLFVGSMIFLSVFLIFPNKTHAQYVDIANNIKEYVADPFAYQVANQLLKKMTASTIKWINGGFKGKPAYVQDPSQFFLDTADDAASLVLSNTSLNRLCAPFNPQVRLALVKNYINQDQNFCTLSKVKDNYDQFTQDFSQGGWDGWFEITQNSSNNPYGAYLNIQSEINKTIDSQTKKYSDQLLQGNGVLSFETCKPGTQITQAEVDQGYVVDTPGHRLYITNQKAGDCFIQNKQTSTPGSVIESQLNEVLGSANGKLKVADEVNEIIGAALSEAATLALGKAGGLFGGSKKTSGSQTLADKLATEPQDPLPNSSAGNVGSVTGSMTCVQQPDKTDNNGNTIHGQMSCVINTGKADLCPVSPNARGNDPGAPNSVDVTKVVWNQANLSTWIGPGLVAGVGANLNNVGADQNLIHFDYTTPNWPAFDIGNGPSNPALASTWVFVWRKDTATTIAINDDVRSKLIDLENALSVDVASRPGFLSSTSLRTWFLSPNIWPQVGDNDGGLLGSNSVKPKTDRYQNILNAVSDAEDFVKFYTIDDPNQDPKPWNFISGEIANLETETDKTTTLFNDIRNNNGHTNQTVKAIDFAKMEGYAKTTIPAIDALLAKIDLLLNPPPAGTGKWNAYPFSYLFQNRPNDVSTGDIFCSPPDFKPTAGETYGFMISTPAGSQAVIDDQQNLKEKSNIIQYVWPDGIKKPAPGTPTLPDITIPPDFGTGGGGTYATCADTPTALACSASNQTALVDRVINYVRSAGIYNFIPKTADWCGKYEIVRRVACTLGTGVLVSYHSSSCNGIDGRYIAFSDNSELKVLNDNGSTWDPGPPGTEYPGVRYQAPDCPNDPPGSY